MHLLPTPNSVAATFETPYVHYDCTIIFLKQNIVNRSHNMAIGSVVALMLVRLVILISRFQSNLIHQTTAYLAKTCVGQLNLSELGIELYGVKSVITSVDFQSFYLR